MKYGLVTGGSKGIGLAISQVLLQHDYFVIINYARDEENATKTEKQLSNLFGNRFAMIKQPLEEAKDVEVFIKTCKEKSLLASDLDAVVLNAGCTDRTCWRELTWESWMHVMNVNINAPAALLRTADPYINKNAVILFISSDMSVYPHATSVPYTVSKSAVNGLTKALVKEYSEKKIRVNALLPGFVETPWQKNKPEDQRKRICDKVALHRFAEPEEIAEVAWNVLSSTYINGALIQVDGGYCYR